MTISWNAAADAKLLVAVIATSKTKVDTKAVAKFMGDDVTPNAITHRLVKLRAKAKCNTSTANTPSKPETNGKEGPETPTPSPQKKRVNNHNSAAGKKRRAADDDDDDEPAPTPSRKSKKVRAFSPGTSEDNDEFA